MAGSKRRLRQLGWKGMMKNGSSSEMSERSDGSKFEEGPAAILNPHAGKNQREARLQRTMTLGSSKAFAKP